jgi:hypothetical protein
MVKLVTFSDNVHICETYNKYDYNRVSMKTRPIRYLPFHELKILRYIKIKTSINLGMYNGCVDDFEHYSRYIDHYRKIRIIN